MFAPLKLVPRVLSAVALIPPCGVPNVPALAARYPPNPPPRAPPIAPAFTSVPVTFAVIAPSPAPTIAELTTAPAVVAIAPETAAPSTPEAAIELAIAGAATGIITIAATAITFLTPPPCSMSCVGYIGVVPAAGPTETTSGFIVCILDLR